MARNEGGLHTLTYQVDPMQLGQVVLYPLPSAFTAAWDRFAAMVKRRAGWNEVAPRYSNLATALTATTGQPVRLFPAFALSVSQKTAGIDALLVTTGPIDPWLMTTAVRTFERLSLGDDKADTLAPTLTGVEPAVERLSAHVTYQDGKVQAPGWLYEVAKWSLAARIATEPILVDGHLPIPLRLDSEANLIAWTEPITRVWKSGPRHATVYLDTTIVTLPGAAHLYLRLDAHVARMPSGWWNVKNAWVEHSADETKPLLRLPVRGPWPERGREHPEYRDFVPGVLQACQLDPIPGLPDTIPGSPFPLRLIGNPSRHPVGKGPGARFIFQAQQQILERLGLQEPLFRRTTMTAATKATGHIPADKIDAAIHASGTRRLRITCLYESQLARRRMADALSVYCVDEPGGLTGIADDTAVDLTERLSILFHRNPELLAHGDHTRDIDSLACLTGHEDQAVIAWAETLWEGISVENDAKPALRAELGKRGIIVQFLNTNYRPSKPRVTKDGIVKDEEDHLAKAALRDMLRQAGVIDNRLAIATTRRTTPLTRAATLVGLHIRQHTPRRKNGIKEPNRLVVQLVAIHATPNPEKPWSIEMYDDSEGWITYREANARYYTADIGDASLGRSREKAPLVREYVDQALSAIPKNTPLVAFVDAEAGRSLWGGLTNSRFGRDRLPGSSIGHPDLAVVRCASATNVPRPSHRSHPPLVADPHKPNLPGASLYEHEENGILTWILAHASRLHRSGPQWRGGTEFTRWTLPESRDRWMSDDWHGLTAIEIAVPQSGHWQPNELAALTARLCSQAASWDDRTRLPTPLHLAKASDEDHPGHPPADDAIAG